MPAAEFTNWMRYSMTTPLPHYRVENQIARLTQCVVGMFGKPQELTKYLIDYNPKPQTIQDIGNTFLRGMVVGNVGIDNQSSSEPVI